MGGENHLALVRRNHDSRGVIPFILDWKIDWYGGIDYGMDYGIYINTQLCCVDICLLTYS